MGACLLSLSTNLKGILIVNSKFQRCPQMKSGTVSKFLNFCPQWFVYVEIHFWLPVSCLPSFFCLFIVYFTLCFSFQTLYNQFKFFLNMYFLVVASSQFITELRIGYLYTYWGPLVSIKKDVFMHT